MNKTMMKWKSLLVGIIVVAAFTGTVLVSASLAPEGYVVAPWYQPDPNLPQYNPDGVWTVDDLGYWKKRPVGDGIRYRRHITIENVGDYPLTEAVARLYVVIWVDGKPIRDPAIINEKLSIRNAEIFPHPKYCLYIIHLGTIQPEHLKKFLLNVWLDEQITFSFALTVWYLPLE